MSWFYILVRRSQPEFLQKLSGPATGHTGQPVAFAVLGLAALVDFSRPLTGRFLKPQISETVYAFSRKLAVSVELDPKHLKSPVFSG
jgi:hypothetical protein